MFSRNLGLLLGAAIVGLPLATAHAGPHTPIASNGKDVRTIEAGSGSVSRGYRGTSGSNPGVIEDALSSATGGPLSADELEWLENAVPMTAPIGTESIIGNDTRKKVGNTKRYPNRAVVLIIFDTPDGTSRCTGWMISKNTLATAGHCVYDPSFASFYSTNSYELYPAYTGSSAPYGSCGASSLHTVQGWADGKDDYDYGAIKLDCKVGKKTGWLGYYYTKKNRKLKGKRVTITGFPGDKPYTMWKSKGRVKKVQKRRVFYKNDTTGGMSGSPVYHKKRNCGQCSMAIHAYGTYGSYPFSKFNHGTRITRSVYKNLQSWKKN